MVFGGAEGDDQEEVNAAELKEVNQEEVEAAFFG